MKILLLSDTHGQIDRITELAGTTDADLCIHAGDFGFYDADSISALTQRELYLTVKHSPLPPDVKSGLLKQNAKEWRKAIKEFSLPGNFPDYLSGKRHFPIPVYAVWGNHDDVSLAVSLQRKPIQNLHILHEKCCSHVDCFRLFGIGGNCVVDKNFVQTYRKASNLRCRPASHLEQYLSLLQTASGIPEDIPRILVTHVSPLQEPFLELLAWQTEAVLTVSGHMGYHDGKCGVTDPSRIPGLQATFRTLQELLPMQSERLERFRPVKAEHRITHINLPDARNGYALLHTNGTDFSIEMRGRSFDRC